MRKYFKAQKGADMAEGMAKLSLEQGEGKAVNGVEAAEARGDEARGEEGAAVK